MFIIFIQDGKVNGSGQCECLTEGVQNYEVSEELYNAFNENPDKYIYLNGAVVEDPTYLERQLQKAKLEKYTEAKEEAYTYLESGEALYEFQPNKHIEATDGNIAKLGLSLIQLLMAHDEVSTIPWNTKEDENVELNAGQLDDIVSGLKAVQEEVWTVKYAGYVEAIEAAETVEEVEAIEIDYTMEEEAEE